MLQEGGWLFRQQEQVPPDLKDSGTPDGSPLSTVYLDSLALASLPHNLFIFKQWRMWSGQEVTLRAANVVQAVCYVKCGVVGLHACSL